MLHGLIFLLLVCCIHVLVCCIVVCNDIRIRVLSQVDELRFIPEKGKSGVLCVVGRRILNPV